MSEMWFNCKNCEGAPINPDHPDLCPNCSGHIIKDREHSRTDFFEKRLELIETENTRLKEQLEFSDKTLNKALERVVDYDEKWVENKHLKKWRDLFKRCAKRLLKLWIQAENALDETTEICGKYKEALEKIVKASNMNWYDARCMQEIARDALKGEKDVCIIRKRQKNSNQSVVRGCITGRIRNTKPSHESS